MKQYECERCHYQTTDMSSYRRHLKREIPCKPEFSFVEPSVLLHRSYIREDKPVGCPHCHKRFSSDKNMKYHIKTAHSDEGDDQTTRPIASMCNENCSGSIQQNNITGGVSVNINNLVINALGKEDISYITNHPNFQRFMIKCIREQMDGLCTYLTKKHLHPDHPENHNIRKLTKKEDFIEFFDGKQWRLSHTDRVMETVLNEIEKDFQNCIDCLSEPLTDNLKKPLDIFMTNIGKALGWDLTGINYSDDDIDEPSDVDKQQCKKRFLKLLCELIYRFSRTKRKEELGKL